MNIIEVNCTQDNCPAYDTCGFSPTKFFPIDDKVSILFVELRPDEHTRRLIQGAILQAKSEWGQPFGVAFSEVTRSGKEVIKYCNKYLFRDIKRLKKVYDLRVIMPLGYDAKSIFLNNDIKITLDRENIYTINNNIFGPAIVKPSEQSFLVEDILESLRRINL